MKMEKAAEQDKFKTKQQFINVHLYEMLMLMKL